MIIEAEHIFNGHEFQGAGRIHVKGKKIEQVVAGGGAGAQLVTPGFIDSHVHLLSVGMNLQALGLNHCQNRAEFQSTIKDYLLSHDEHWVQGRGWDQNKLGFTPDRSVLDELCPHRPMVLRRTCGHVLAANSRALELAGVEGATDVSGGVIKRDISGKPTGILEEKAMDLVNRVIPTPQFATLYTALEEGIKYAHSWGITGVQTDDRGSVGDYFRLWDLYTRVTESHPLRSQLHYSINSADSLEQFIQAKQELDNSQYVFAGAAKIFLDGSLGARTAALLEDYADDPGNKGVLVYPDSVLTEIVSLAEENDIQLAMHAIGDAAIEQALRVVSQVRGGYVQGKQMHRLIHCQIINDSQIQRMLSLGMMAEVQPGFLQTDMHWALGHLGQQRLQSSYCWRSMAQAGLFMTGGSDSPVEVINPWQGVHTAVTRRDREGNLAQGWHRDESLPLAKVLTMYTSAGADLAAWRNLGRIAAGASADIAIYEDFSQDLKENRPSTVLVGGNSVYQG